MSGRAWLYAFSAVLLWSTVATVFKLTLRHVDFIHLLLISSWTAFLALLLVMIAQGKVSLLRRLTVRELLYSAGLGALNPYVYYLVLFKAYSLIPAQEALALNYTWPVVLVLLSVPLLGQRIGPGSVAAILVSFSGVVLIATRGDLGTPGRLTSLGRLPGLGLLSGLGPVLDLQSARPARPGPEAVPEFRVRLPFHPGHGPPGRGDPDSPNGRDSWEASIPDCSKWG